METTLKMAEALILRADAQKRFEQLKQRLQQNARIQEGDTPAEAPPTCWPRLSRSPSS